MSAVDVSRARGSGKNQYPQHATRPLPAECAALRCPWRLRVAPGRLDPPPRRPPPPPSALARILHNHCLADHQENPIFTLRAARRAAKRRRERHAERQECGEDWDEEESEGEGEE